MVLQVAEKYADAYIDDIVIRSNSFCEHYDNLRDVLKRLKAEELTSKPSKYVIGAVQSRYLGYVIGSGQIKP